MKSTTLVFDIGKTNKKLLLFGDQGELTYEQSEQLPETKDEDDFPCEDIQLLKRWVLDSWKKILSDPRFEITAVNLTAYGASLVHLDDKDEPFTPLYSYLKPFPDALKKKFQATYGNIELETASPLMGMLNSGLQLYWLKNTKPDYFKKIKTTLHFPQYLSFLITGKKYTEYTSIGCHTAMWNFEEKDYHSWIYKEGFDTLFPELISQPIQQEIQIKGKNLKAGSGLHDSSASLLPYAEKYDDPFVLLSTGTWCINLAPFNQRPLTIRELSSDCLSYLTPYGKKVKASRVFIGKEHEYQVQRIAAHFGVSEKFYTSIPFETFKLEKLLHETGIERRLVPSCIEETGWFTFTSTQSWDLSCFSNHEDAYYQLMLDLSCMVFHSAQLLHAESAVKIFIEGGFTTNDLFVNLMVNHFPDKEVLISCLPQATSLGAAMAMGIKMDTSLWSFKKLKPAFCSQKLKEYTDLKKYSPQKTASKNEDK